MKEETEAVAEALEKQYGPRVEVRYVDIYSNAFDAYPEVMRFLFEKNVPLPLVLVGGEPLVAGGVPYDEISEAIEEIGVAPLV